MLQIPLASGSFFEHNYSPPSPVCACFMAISDRSDSPPSTSKRSKQGKATGSKDKKTKDKDKVKERQREKPKDKKSKKKEKPKEKVKEDETMQNIASAVHGLPTPPQSPKPHEKNANEEEKQDVNQGGLPAKQPRRDDENQEGEQPEKQTRCEDDLLAKQPRCDDGNQEVQDVDKNATVDEKLRHDDEDEVKENESTPAQEPRHETVDMGGMPRPEAEQNMEENMGMDNMLPFSQYCWNGPVVQRQPWEIAFVQQGLKPPDLDDGRFHRGRPGRYNHLPPLPPKIIMSTLEDNRWSGWQCQRNAVYVAVPIPRAVMTAGPRPPPVPHPVRSDVMAEDATLGAGGYFRPPPAPWCSARDQRSGVGCSEVALPLNYQDCGFCLFGFNYLYGLL